MKNDKTLYYGLLFLIVLILGYMLWVQYAFPHGLTESYVASDCPAGMALCSNYNYDKPVCADDPSMCPLNICGNPKDNLCFTQTSKDGKCFIYKYCTPLACWSDIDC